MPSLFNNPTLIRWAPAVGFLLLSLLLAWLGYQLIRRTAERIRRKSPDALLPPILLNIASPILLIIVLQGIFLALGTFPGLSAWRSWFIQVDTILILLLLTHALAQAASILMAWYGRTVATRTKTALDDTFTPIVRRILVLAIYAFGALVLLDTMGITVAPMLTGLGLGGLAVALALQPTLASFFAGLQVLTDQIVSEGDYIELENGFRGYVVSVGWRSTRIRSTYQNLTVIPNSRLVETIITNYDHPHKEVAVIVECGVSYDSDLHEVERIAREVTKEVIAAIPEAVKDKEPWFGFDTFGDSNINFWIWHYAVDYIATFRFKSELIKHLHSRFMAEGIEINYPVRKLVYEEPEEDMGLNEFRPVQ